MRVLRVLLALGIPALFASVSQAQAPNSQGSVNGQGHDAAHCAMRAALHPGAVINKCDPPPVVTPPPPPSGASITGTVYNSNTGVGLPGWTVLLGGDFSATAITDASGHYSFTGLSAGNYTVCEVMQAGFSESYPSPGYASCGLNGWGYSFSILALSVNPFIDFANF
jgi:hypothetical protein